MSEVVWTCSFALMCVGGLIFRVLPMDRRAALRGVAAGLGMALWMATLVWLHFGPR